MSEPFRMLPASDAAERGVVCSFMIAPKQIGGYCAERGVTHEAFHNPALGTIFAALMAMWMEGAPIDLITLTQRLADHRTLEAVGGAAHIGELFTYLPTATNAGSSLRTLAEKRTLRDVVTICREYQDRAYEEQEDVTAIIEGLGAAVAQAAGATLRKGAKTFKESLFEKMDRIEGGKPETNIIRTGLSLLDYHSPLHYGDMPMIAGEKKAGKSILSLSLAMNMAGNGLPVLYFSLEDRTEQVIDRIFAGATRIPIVRQNSKSLNEGDFPRITRAMGELADHRVQIRDDVFDLSQIVAVARQQKSKWPDLAAIFVDYLQLVRTAKDKNVNREQEVATVSRTFRLLGMELNAAVVVLSQLNEAGKTRESRAIEQDITAAWMVNRPEDDNDANSVRVLSIPFQRNGESGIKFPVSFLGHFARMEDAARDTPQVSAGR